jgi:hypothetical protein
VAWVETRSPPFLVRHGSAAADEARGILATLDAAHERVAVVLGAELDEVTVVVHESELLLALAHPVLPVLRRLTAPAARRYLAGWAAGGELHVLTPRLLERRASSVPGSREMLALTPAALHARLVLGAQNPRLPPPFTAGATIRFARWAWLVEGAAQWLSGQTAHARPAISRRLHEGREPAFPPGLRDATLLGGSVLDLLAREEGPDAVAGLLERLHPRGPKAALAAAFGGRPLARTADAWRASLRR